MPKPSYTLRKTKTALSQLQTASRAILYSGHLTKEESTSLYNAYELINEVDRAFRWRNLEKLEPESYQKLMSIGKYHSDQI